VAATALLAFLVVNAPRSFLAAKALSV